MARHTPRKAPNLTVARLINIASDARAEYERHEDHDRGLQYTALWLLEKLAKQPPDRVEITPQLAESVVGQFVDRLLESDQFEAAAALLWGHDVFTAEPESVSRVWAALFKHDRLLVPGGGALGKSYGGAAWFYLAWRQDPAHTSIKVVSLTAEHAERNLFASIKNFHRTALVPPTGLGRGEDLAKSIQVTGDAKQGIHLVAIPKGESGFGVLRGFHPSPREGKPHPRFGRLSRNFVVLDEAEEIPGGVWEGVNNLCSTMTPENAGHIKVFGASNPKDRTSDFGARCEPERGWGSIDCEEDLEWDSRDGWRVLRLDAKRCENVVEKRVVYPGLQTYEGFMQYESRGKTAEYATMARGWFPQEGVSMAIITPAMMDNAVGMVRFIGPVVSVAAFDLALEGNDQLLCTYGRFGLSDGWTPLSGKFVSFPSPRVVVQVDSQMPFPKGDTVKQTEAIIRFCRQMRISPTWTIVDRTGNGSGVHDLLLSRFGPEVYGVNYSTMATDTRVLGDDSQRANELYHGVVSELIFGLGKYLEFGFVKLAPGFRQEDLVRQATGRRYKQKGKGLVRVESKAEYCKRTRQKSPDALDSLSLLVFLVRQRGDSVASMTDPRPEPRRQGNPVWGGKGIESMSFVDFSET
jgi:hypothetical protein